MVSVQHSERLALADPYQQYCTEAILLLVELIPDRFDLREERRVKRLVPSTHFSSDIGGCEPAVCDSSPLRAGKHPDVSEVFRINLNLVPIGSLWKLPPQREMTYEEQSSPLCIL